jgi:hypothetical protein
MMRLVASTCACASACFSPDAQRCSTSSECGSGFCGPDGLCHAAAPDASPLALTAIAWWKLDDGTGTVATDSIGTANGSLGTGAGGLPTWAAGMSNGALSFAGDGDHVTLGVVPELANTPVTVVGWIRPTSITNGGHSHCLVDRGGDDQRGWSFEFFSFSDGSLTFEAYFSPTDFVQRTSIPGVLSAGTWARVAASWDGGNQYTGVHLYVGGGETAYSSDGRQDASGVRPDDGSTEAFINCGSEPGSLSGSIDDVLVFDRVLGAAEIATL